MKSRSVYDDASPATPIYAEDSWVSEPFWVAQRFWRGVFFGTLLSLPCWALILTVIRLGFL
jgi:hypothetical protein